MAEGRQATASSSGRLVKWAMIVLGVYQLTLAAFVAIAPRTFYDAIAPFDVYSPHYLQDVAAFEGALGIGVLVAAQRVSWRPVGLAFALAHYGLHAISHLLDIGAAEPSWVGAFDFAAIFLGFILLALLLARALADARVAADRAGP